jgi:peptide/nickel transport system substrate-binding protein
VKTTRRGHKLLATAAAVSLVLAACGGDDDDDAGDDTAAESTADADTGETSAEETADADTGDMSEEDTSGDMSEEDTSGDMSEEDTAEGATSEEDTATGSDVSFGYGNAQEFASYNNTTSTHNAVQNTVVLTQVLPAPYNFAGPGGELQLDEELMDSVTVVSEDPQIIEYVVNADAAWSDGEPIDCDDFYFAWRAYTGEYKQLDEDGNPVIDEESELEINLFDVASTSGTEDISSVTCSEDGKTITVEFGTLYADWQAIYGTLLPAHIIEQQAGVEDLIAAFESDDRAAIEAMAEWFNDGWSLNPGELLPDLMPSGNKLAIDSWEAGSSLTLVPNDAYWGTPANGPVTIRYIAEEAQAQALANGEITAMDPQPSPDLLAQLEGIDGVTIETGNQYTWEHFDFNFATPALQNRDVREAFAKCLPRQQMVANLIQPLVPDAIVLNNRLIQEFEDAYVDNSGGLYDEVDFEGASELLANSGEALPIEIRVGWNDAGNQRRTDQVALVVESCNQVEGFEVTNAGTSTFFSNELSAGDWDVAMFAWAGSPLKSGQDQLYSCEGGGNYGGYCNEEVDALTTELNATVDPAQQLEIANQIDVLLWEDLATIPVFSFPGVAAWSDSVANVVYNPSQNGVMWNAGSWQVV